MEHIPQAFRALFVYNLIYHNTAIKTNKIHNNILFSNLKSDGLHLNEGGVRKFAGNLNKFIKYTRGRGMVLRLLS